MLLSGVADCRLFGRKAAVEEERGNVDSVAASFWFEATSLHSSISTVKIAWAKLWYIHLGRGYLGVVSGGTLIDSPQVCNEKKPDARVVKRLLDFIFSKKMECCR